MASDNNKKSSLSKRHSAKLTPLIDEDEWVIQIRTLIEEEIEEEDKKIPASIFCVPQAVVSCKPEAYAPQLFAFGPYHHWRPQLYDMERYKLAAARRTQARLGGLKFSGIVANQFLRRDFKIRCHYQRHLDLSAETLAWMMAIDTCFVLEFLQNSYAERQTEAQQAAEPSAASKRMEMERRKMGFNMIFRDIAMLENQIPLFLLQKLLNLMYPSKEQAKQELSNMLVEFIKELSPFKTIDETVLDADNVRHFSHLLEVLYRSIIPKSEEQLRSSEINDEISEQKGDETGWKDEKEVKLRDPSAVRKVFNWVWRLLSNAGFIKSVLFSRPVMFVFKFPWKVITALPIFSIIKLPVENFFSQMLPKEKSDDEKSAVKAAEKPPLVEEITIPSVTQLNRTGVKFLATTGDITTIMFDAKTITMYLPVIGLDINTEVVIRNLVAYEASAVRGPLVFTRYTELMCGIIDTEEDVKILRDAGIVVNRLKSDGEAAEVWNGMSRSVRLNKVGFLDKAIRDVNKYYGSRWRVKCRVLMRRYIFDSWQILTFLAAGLLLFMSCVQAFCSVYSCSAHISKITGLDMGDQS